MMAIMEHARVLSQTWAGRRAFPQTSWSCKQPSSIRMYRSDSGAQTCKNSSWTAACLRVPMQKQLVGLLLQLVMTRCQGLHLPTKHTTLHVEFSAVLGSSRFLIARHTTRLMAWTLRVRGTNGQAVISGLAADSNCLELQEKIHGKLGIAPARQELLAGFPPRIIQTSANGQLSDVGIVNGDSLTVREKALPESAADPTAAHASSNGYSPAPAQAAPGNSNGFSGLDEDAQLAAAIAASLRDSSPPSAAISQPQAPRPTPAGKGPAPTSVQLPDGSCVVRRVIPSDNSCLFNAVGYVMEHDRHKAAALRKVIADTVAGDPETYNDGFLDQDNAAYCTWIQNPKHWGGAIELSILSRHYGRQIDAYDIQTKRCDRYGQDEGYSERVMLIYDGLHYDAMAVSAFEGAPEDLDITVLQMNSQESSAAESGAAKLVAACHEARQFTDVANFTLRCGVCQIGLKGEKEAVMHAKETGHQNFVEY